MNILKLIGRDSELFEDDIKKHGKELNEIVRNSKFLVVGGGWKYRKCSCKRDFQKKSKKTSCCRYF